MRILILSPYLPWPPRGGNTLRIFGILKELAERGHEIHLLAGHEGPPPDAESPLPSLCRTVEFYRPPASSYSVRPWVSGLRALFSPYPYVASKFGGPRVQQAVRSVLEKCPFDLILANFAFLADSVPVEFAKRTPVVLDEHESEGLLWHQYLRQGHVAMRGFALLNLLKLVWFRKRLAARVAAMLCASDRETEYAHGFIPHQIGLWTVPNGIDADAYSSLLAVPRDTPAIILCGVIGVYRNQQAALWFAQRVFPSVREKIPDAELWIVGAGPPPEVRVLEKSPGIHVTGTVEDVRPYYQKAAVSVAPFRFGEGTKLKVLEAMASGVPVVGTPIGCQGIDVQDGEHVLIADAEVEFGNRVIELLRDAQLRSRLACAARRLVEQRYTWKKIVGDIEPQLLELARKGPNFQSEGRSQ